MSQAIRERIKQIVDDATKLARVTLATPTTEREYLIRCGRYQAMMAEARSLKETFLQPEQPDPEDDLPADDMPAEPRRVSPQRDRVDAVRARHRPRQM